MDLMTMYKYAYWGTIEELKMLMKLYDMCIEVGDGDAADEYLTQINKTKSDFDFIISALGYNKESSWQVLAYELRKVGDNYEVCGR